MKAILKASVFLVLLIVALATLNCRRSEAPPAEPTLVTISLKTEFDLDFDVGRNFDGNAEVLVNGELVSNSLSRDRWVQIHLPQGSHTLTVGLEGYKNLEKKVRILDTKSQQFLFELKLER